MGRGGEAGPPTAYHSESYREVYARNLSKSKGQGAKRDHKETIRQKAKVTDCSSEVQQNEAVGWSQVHF